jgi:hypothetical protein
VSSCNDCGIELIGTENFCPESSISTDDSQDAIVIDSALPVSVDYEEVIKVKLNNPQGFEYNTGTYSNHKVIFGT